MHVVGGVVCLAWCACFSPLFACVAQSQLVNCGSLCVHTWEGAEFGGETQSLKASHLDLLSGIIYGSHLVSFRTSMAPGVRDCR